MPIFEPGLEELFRRNATAGRLTFVGDLAKLNNGDEAVFIAVGTPPSGIDQSADLSSVFAVARDVARTASTGLACDRHQVDGSGRTGDEIAGIMRSDCAELCVPCRVEPRIPPRRQRDRISWRPTGSSSASRTMLRAMSLKGPTHRSLPRAPPLLSTSRRRPSCRGPPPTAFFHQDLLDQEVTDLARRWRRRRGSCRRWALIPHGRPSCAPGPARRLLLPEGLPTPCWPTGRTLMAVSHVISSAVATNAAARTPWRGVSFAPWGAALRAAWSPCLASRSRPTPTTCAKRRPSPSSMV